MECLLIDDFSDESFQIAFKEYFKELAMEFNDWGSLFESMNSQGGNLAYLLRDKNEVVGFLQFRIEKTEHWFITEEFGFIREFWIKSNYRNQHFGTELLSNVENCLLKKQISKVLLTTDTAPSFYLKNGYHLSTSYSALNKDPVYFKLL